MKSKGMNDEQFLAILEKVLPKATQDTRLASTIYDKVLEEVRLINNVKSFEKYCVEGRLPDLEPATIQEFKEQLTSKFKKAEVTVEPAEKGDSLAVEIVLPDRKITNRMKVAVPGEDEEDETKAKFVPFPVALPEDPGLLWILARREDVGPDEAGIFLASAEEEFWETKAGLKLLKDRVEKTFGEFIANVPAAALLERGLKRHYKEPEPSKTLNRGPQLEGKKRSKG